VVNPRISVFIVGPMLEEYLIKTFSVEFFISFITRAVNVQPYIV